MKSIFLGLFFAIVLLPHVSFGAIPSINANPQSTSFTQQQDADSRAFFQQQAADRAAFIKLHTDLITKLDHLGRQMVKQRREQLHPGLVDHDSEPAAEPLSADENKTWSTFVQKQLSEKQAFLAKQAQDRQKQP